MKTTTQQSQLNSIEYVRTELKACIERSLPKTITVSIVDGNVVVTARTGTVRYRFDGDRLVYELQFPGDTRWKRAASYPLSMVENSLRLNDLIHMQHFR